MQDGGDTGGKLGNGNDAFSALTKFLGASGGDTGGKTGGVPGTGGAADILNKITNIGGKSIGFDSTNFTSTTDFFKNITDRMSTSTPAWLTADQKKSDDLSKPLPNEALNLNAHLDRLAAKDRLDTLTARGKNDLLASSYAGALRDQATKSSQTVTGSGGKDWLGL